MNWILEIRSDDPEGKAAQALAKAQGEMPLDLKTDATANMGTYSYRYLTLPALLAAVLPILRKQKLAPVYSVGVVEGVGNVMALRMLHEAGGWLEFHCPLSVNGNAQAQDVGSAITYARRYLLQMAVGVAPDHDDDGLAATQAAPRATKQQPARAASAAPGTWPVGKHKGKPISEIPLDYLQWAAGNLDPSKGTAHAMACAELERRSGEAMPYEGPEDEFGGAEDDIPF